MKKVEREGQTGATNMTNPFSAPSSLRSIAYWGWRTTSGTASGLEGPSDIKELASGRAERQ